MRGIDLQRESNRNAVVSSWDSAETSHSHKFHYQITVHLEKGFKMLVESSDSVWELSDT